MSLMFTLIILVAVLLGGGFWCRCGEKRSWNHGVCEDCGAGVYECFDVSSQGGRGYQCDQCEHVVWISYPGVDREGLPRNIRGAVVVLEES